MDRSSPAPGPFQLPDDPSQKLVTLQQQIAQLNTQLQAAQTARAGQAEIARLLETQAVQEREMSNQMTDTETRAFVASQNWAFAKTMPQIPHFWSLLKDARDAAEFHRFVRHIDTAGKPMRWRRTPVRRYLDLDGWRYWTMDRDLKDVTLINRQVLSISECVPA